MPEPLQTAGDDLALLSAAGRQLLREWNDTRTDYGPPICLHHLIEAQVDRTPEAVAVVCDGRSLTYAELDRRASRLAHRLLRLGVQPDSPVGICAERSLELMVGLLAILKAGGAYVPLDPEYPKDRLAYMVEDALAGLAAPLLLTQGRLLAALPATGARIVLLDETVEETDLRLETRPELRVDPDQIAYLIYTSGSTGRPKGVMNSHRGIFNRLLWMQETYRLDASDVVLQKTPASFDVSVWEFFWPLLTGARLVMARPGGHRDPAYLARVIQEEGVTTAHFVPSMLSLFLEAPEAGRCASLRRVVCSGEALSHELQQRFFSRLSCELHNLYGPTEAAVDVTYWACRRDGGPPVVPIGWPVANTRILLLDAGLQPVPAGDAGELHIGGIQLARGYWRRPELTAERFVPDPSGAEPGGRLYKTGDLARHRPDGSVEYLGRIDHQVKIHGVRIELGEIEATLEGCSGVRDAVVVVWEAGPGDKRLVAWFVPDGERAPAGAELRAHLRARLSEPMVPSFFVPLPALPQTPNGKVDRKALAQREPPREDGGEGAAPRNPTEELLAGILAEVLGRERVGVDQSFFDLGGDSLRATRVLTRIRAALGVELPHSAVLEAPTVAALAERVEGAAAGQLPPPLPPINPLPRDPRGEPLSLLQRRLWFIERLVPGTSASNIPIVMRLEGPLDLAVLERCLVEIAARHEALRTAVRIGPAGEPHQIIAPPAPFRLSVADLSGLPLTLRMEERARRIREEARHPIDPDQDPLWRRLLLRAGEREHDLLLTFHHVISDGESVQVVERELAALYAAFLDGRPSPLPPPPVQPADVAAWEHESLTPEILAPHLAWFREHLAGASAALDLPADLPRPPVRSWRGRSRALALPPDLTRAVRDLARQRGATAYMALLASWVAFLRRITGQNDVVLGTVLAHRGRPEIEGLVGFFANTLPLRVEIPGDPTFGDLLAGARAGALGLFAHQDQPLEDLAEMLRPGRASTADPLFQAFFALRGNTGRRELAPGLTLSWWEEDHGAAQFDFLLDLEDRGEEIAGRLNVSTDLFLPATVERLARGWEALLAGAVARPDTPVSALPLLSAAERHALLVEWSAPCPPDWNGSVPARVAAWAAAAPELTAALPAEPRLPALTYGELVARARRLASHLRRRGVGPGVRVGVYAERSPETLVGMLAVLLAGGAFLPLDPAYPPERLTLILEDARVPVLLARSGLAAALPTGGAALVPLDDVAGAADLGEALPEIEPGDLAYVIYTSGSTGRPKGVLIPHQGFLWAVEALAERSGLEPGGKVLQFASAGFDASVWEIWSALISGSTLVFARREDVLPGPALLATLRDRGVTNVFLTPTALAAMPEEASRELPGLRGLVVGGEAFPPDLVARWAPGRRLWNAYGPTEASICVAMARLGEDGQTPIGRPVADSRLLVLDHHLEAVPLGVPGELYIGGRGLAHGYLGRADLTAGAFLPDPFSGRAGARLYRTGDLVRFRPDGQLEFLGRADRQVKVRGFRIEPGEIEAQLADHAGVREAVVVPYEAAPGDLRLAAYVVGTGAGAPSAHELRTFLRARLPEHMVPAAFVLLEALPLSPGGKVDRRALPAPVADEPAARGPAAPRTLAEDLLAGIWEEVLGRSEVGPGDDFFDLGGHSLLVGRLLARVRATFGVDLPVRAAFEDRTLGALARRIEEELRTLPEGLPPQPPLVRASRAEPLPLSFAQQRLWLLDRLEPGSVGYNLPLAYRIEGPLIAILLERSLSEVLRRHEVLRTTFAMEESGEPHPVVAPPRRFALPRVDLSTLPAPAREEEAGRLSRAEAARPFDLAAGPLFRAALLALDATRHHLLITMHHIAFDGWSVEVFLGELAALYGAFVEGLPSPLPELAIQYADFAAWQRRWLAGPVLAAQLDHWRRQLAGAPEALDLPTDRPRPAVETSRGAHFSVALPPALAAGVWAFSRGQGVTLFMTLLAGFATQLHRYTGAVDLLLGSPVANRNRGEIEGLLGFFVNTLVMRADLAGDPGFDLLVARVREMALAAYAHQDLPFERLVEELAPQRSLALSPLFQVSFVLGVEAAVYELAPGLPLAPIPVDYRTAKYDLTLAVDVREDALTATFEYRTDLLDRSTVTRWAGHFTHLLAAVIDRPEAPVSAFDLLSPAERHQLAWEWNDTAVLPEPAACLHQLFEAQAARTPEAVALVSPDGLQRLSYRQLDERAEALARRLRALGVGPEVLAGVLLDRSVELIVSLLAVLKAGGAYVPIDPAYPRQRVAALLASSRAAALLTRRPLLADFAGSVPPETVPLIVDEPYEVAASPHRPSQPGNLAYVIYTSGSTGEPKGVAIEHRSAVAFARWAREVYTPEELAGSLGSTSVCFDISIMEIFVTLAWGGKILLAENALALPTLPARDEVTMINAVPSAMAELVRDGRLPDSVRVVNTGGEAVKGPLARRIYEASRAERVIDVYGPSEDTTYSTTALLPRDVETPAIGRPIHGSRAHVLDAGLRPVPIGVPGAVYLAGEGLARGYLGRPALTAERFIPDPHGAPGSRLYRVGDLARYRVDGELEYLGRIDHQVKVRGFRIELGEIEAVLVSHPALEKAVVATHDYGKHGAEDVRLVAWVVPAAGQEVEPEALRAWVGERLPEYMVPAAAVVLAEMPLTPNGKVDRFALPIPEAREGTAAEAPRSPVEELVAGLWTETLGLSRIGLHDDFFALGGYSLLAIRLLARLRAATGLDLPLRVLFAHPTVAALAAEVERGLQAPGTAALPPIEPAGAGDDAPASSAQERLWYFHQLDPGGSVLNVPHPLRLTGPLRPAALAAALTEIARRHASLRTSFQYGEAGLRQRIAPPSAVEIPLADLGALPPAIREGEARRLTLEEARQPFDLAVAPLWRARLFRLGEGEHRLLLTFHHTIFDGWSLDLLEGELAALYPACAAGGQSPLPAPALQYADFAVWQRRWLTDEALAPQLAYWRRQLAGVPTVLDLPTDHPRPPRQSFRGEVLLLPLAADLSAQVTALGRREGTTLLMTALAAFAALLGRYTGRIDVVLGSPAANRHHAETEGLFGFFVGTLVLRLDLSGDPAFRELLRRARETALGAYAHPDVPFERLVEELDASRDKSRNPLVQVMLSVQPMAAGPFRFAGLAAEAIDVHTDTSQFDLSLFFLEGPQGLTLEAEYSTDLFARSTVERMLAHLATLLAAVVANPDLRLSALPAEIAPRPRQREVAVETPPEATPESDLARRQAQLAERRARLAADQKELLAARLRRGK